MGGGVEGAHACDLLLNCGMPPENRKVGVHPAPNDNRGWIDALDCPASAHDVAKSPNIQKIEMKRLKRNGK